MLRKILPSDFFVWLKRKENRVYFLSYPKCGRTWLRLMIGKSISEHFGFDINPLELNELSSENPKVPRFTVQHDGNPHWTTPSEMETDKKRFRYGKVLLLVRDPRDVTISLYHHKVNRNKVFNGTLSEFIREDLAGFQTIIKYYNVWASAKDEVGGFHLVRYEDLHENPTAEVRKILDFIGLQEISEESVKVGVDFANFDNMRKMEQNDAIKGLAMTTPDKSNENAFKTRKGKVGGFAETLNEEDLEYVNKIMKEQLSPFYGYLN